MTTAFTPMRSGSRIRRRRMISALSLAHKRLPFQRSLCCRSCLASNRSLLLRRGIDSGSPSRGRSGMSLRRFLPCAHFCGEELDAPKFSENEAFSPPSALTAYPAQKESCLSHHHKVFGDVSETSSCCLRVYGIVLVQDNHWCVPPGSPEGDDWTGACPWWWAERQAIESPTAGLWRKRSSHHRQRRRAI